jgi:hypothetical protein
VKGLIGVSSTRAYRPVATLAMLIDRRMPEFDATRIEHRVIVRRGANAREA